MLRRSKLLVLAQEPKVVALRGRVACAPHAQGQLPAMCRRVHSVRRDLGTRPPNLAIHEMEYRGDDYIPVPVRQMTPVHSSSVTGRSRVPCELGPGDNGDPLLSFVIAARNECQTIGLTIDSIHSVTHGRFASEVIVIDNGSTDATVPMSVAKSAAVFVQKTGTIGSLRNLGAQHATGEVVVFVDGDVWLAEEWGVEISDQLARLAARPRRVIGSFCNVPVDATWIERHWFQPRTDRPTHVGSGHMIVSRKFFLELGGFDDSLETGEDFDFCQRAVQAGGEIVLCPRLKAVHEGFPKTIAAFVQREAWHGTGDFMDLKRIFQSKVALATIGFVGLHLGGIVSLVIQKPSFAFGFLASIAIACIWFAAFKQGYRSAMQLMAASCLSYLYFLGRVLALFRRLWGRAIVA